MTLFLSDPPHIKSSGSPKEVTVLVNNVMELECEATGIPTPTLTWLKDGRPLLETSNQRLLRGGEVLRVASAQVSLFLFKFRYNVSMHTKKKKKPFSLSAGEHRQVQLLSQQPSRR